jgi:hypothetical protein
VDKPPLTRMYSVNSGGETHQETASLSWPVVVVTVFNGENPSQRIDIHEPQT